MGLDAVDFVMAVEEEFGIEIPDAEVENILTVGELVDFVYAISPEEIYPESRFVEDLGLG